MANTQQHSNTGTQADDVLDQIVETIRYWADGVYNHMDTLARITNILIKAKRL